MPEDCLFCKIASGQIPGDIVMQDDEAVAFRDISPQGPTHVLVIPRRHVGNAASLRQADAELGGRLVLMAAQVAEQEIEAYPHREMFGAWGQALDIITQIKELEGSGRKYGTAFRGWEIVDMPFKKRKVPCRELFAERSCGLFTE